MERQNRGSHHIHVQNEDYQLFCRIEFANLQQVSLTATRNNKLAEKEERRKRRRDQLPDRVQSSKLMRPKSTPTVNANGPTRVRNQTSG